MAQLPPDAPSNPPPSAALAGAIAAAAAAPDRPELWDEVERLAGDEQRPDEVASLYDAVLVKPLAREVALELCERAVAFLGEWFEDPHEAVPVLQRALAIDPTAAWAFRRLTMILTVDRQWDELFALYDRVLASTPEPPRRVELYTEAAQVAKDLAGSAERAIDYLQALAGLTPLDAGTAGSLERLLDREGRYRDLVTLWRGQLAGLEAAEAQARRAQIAGCLLDRLESPGEALTAVQGLLSDPAAAASAIDLVERVFVFPASPPEVRAAAREDLRRYYAQSGRSAEIIRVLRTALETADAPSRAKLHREIAELLVEQGRDVEALDHYAELASLDPWASESLTQLRALAERVGRLDRYAEALTRAADACEAIAAGAAPALAGAEPAAAAARAVELLFEAGGVRRDTIADPSGASLLYWRIFQAHEPAPETLLEVCRRLDDLLQGAGSEPRRLEVLERRAALEPVAADKRSLRAEGARLAEALGDESRALAGWARVLADDPTDREAHLASIALLDHAQRWEELIAALHRAADAPPGEAEQREHLVRAARVHERRLGAVGPAVDAWRAIEGLFGENDETIDALAALLTTAERWDELAAVLTRGVQAAAAADRRIELTQRLGDVLRTRLAQPEGAIERYRAVLAEQPAHPGARAGLTRLLGEAGSRAAAVELLLQAFDATGDWAGRLALLEHRLEEAPSDLARSELLREAADLEEQRAADPEAALRTLARALPLSPDDVATERRILRLAEATGGWSIAARSLGEAVAVCPAGPRAAELHYQRGAILEQPLSDPPAALAAYLAALGFAPERLDAARAALRVATRARQWDTAARTLVASARSRGSVDPALLAILEEAASGAPGGWEVVPPALSGAVGADAALPRELAGTLERRVAIWHRDRRKDPVAAEASLLRALEHSADAMDTLRMLAGVQRAVPGRALVDTLIRLADAGHQVLGALREAATVAMGTLHDDALARSILERLLRELASQLQAGAPPDGGVAARPVSAPMDGDSWGGGGDEWDAPDGSPPGVPFGEPFSGDTFVGAADLRELSSFAVDSLVALASGQKDHARAIGILVEASALPLGAPAARSRLHEAAAIAEGPLADHTRAVELYRKILEAAPGDERAIDRLSALFARDERVDDMLALRTHQLALATTPAARIRLRLSISELLGQAGDAAGRVTALRENLDDEPAHAQSLEELAGLLFADGRFAELAGVLEEQAGKLEDRGEGARAAALWTRASELAELDLHDAARALAARSRAVAFTPTAETFDALARLSAARGAHADAVAWLDKRLLALAPDQTADRVSTVVRLAAAEVGAGRPELARERLEASLREHPEAGALREPLRALYRASGAWERLVELLTDPAEPPTLEHLREAAEVCARRLGSFERAIPILDATVTLAPGDRAVRLALASALRGTGQLDRARSLLAGLLEEYGRRRTPERAEVHFQLGQVAAAAGDGAESQRQLEAAIGISPEHPGALRMLGRAYRAAADLPRAERVYGALLLIALRQRPGEGEADDPDRPARSEVMINIHWILRGLHQDQRAAEMLASAFDAARSSEVEARRLEQALREGEDHPLLLRAIETRLARADLDEATRASLLSDQAAVLAGPLERPEEALGALLGALGLDPSSAALQKRAIAVARRAAALPRLATALAELADHAEDAGRSALAAALLFALGEVQERDLGDPAAALATFARAEALGAEPLPVWRAIDRAAAATGNRSAQIGALRQIVFAGEGSDPAGFTEDIYRLAELELATAAEAGPGLGSLEWAMNREPRHDRAGKMLRRAAEVAPEPAVLAMYERVARASGDKAMLLDALDRAAWADGAGMDVIREAVELASAAEDQDRVEDLLHRAIDLGEHNPAGLGETVWAFVALANRRETNGDVEDAYKFLGRAVDAAEHDEALALSARRVTLALGPLESPRLAAEAYERILERDRHDRDVWVPLLDIYRRLGDEAVLEGKLRDAIECAFEAPWRIQLRMERARLLVEGRPDDAAAELDEVLQEDEDNDEAALLLTRIREQQGQSEGLGEILERRLGAARVRRDAPAVVELSLRLGTLWAGDKPAQAIDVFRAALDLAPENVPLLDKLLALYASEEHAEDRASIMERLLALDHEKSAADRALALAALRTRLDDEEGTVRALDLGFRAVPGHPVIREQLVAFYTAHGGWAPLAEMLAFEGESADGAAGVPRLREAAALYLDRLSRPREAAEALGIAVSRLPGDLGLLVDYARALARAGDHPSGIAKVTEALDRGPASSADRVTLLRLRAELSIAPGEVDLATADLESAYALDPRATASDLGAILERRRALPEGQRDRALALRLFDLLLDMGQEDRARKLLHGWLEQQPEDQGVLLKAAELEGHGGRWEEAAELCQRLFGLEQGPARNEAALLFAGASEHAGMPLDARPILEQVLREAPTDERIRERLRRIYEQLGAHRELAHLDLTEARVATDAGEKFAALRRAGLLLVGEVSDPAAAIAPLEAARELRPKDADVIVHLADAYIGADRLREAADLLDGAIGAQKGRRSREISMMQQRMAAIACAVGDRTNEMAWLNAACEADAQNGEATSKLADVATELGQLDVALKALKAITLMKAPKPLTRAMAYYRQALIAQHQGDVRKAVLLAKKAQQEDPQLQEAAALLEQLSA